MNFKCRLIQNLVLGFGLSFIATSCTATSGMGAAKLTQVDQQPCFSIEDNIDNRRNPPMLRGISVYDIGSKPVTKVWSFGIPQSSQFVLQSSTCIQYGELPSGAEQTSPPMKLEFGNIYDVAVNARAKSSTGSVYLYRVKFCLIKDVDGKSKVHEIQWDDKQGRWRYDMCKP